MSNMKPYILITFSLLLGLACKSQAQGVDQSKFWLSGGLGKTRFISGMIAAGYEPGNRNSIIISRYSVDGELIPALNPGLKTSELGLLYGLKSGKFSFSAGLSTVWGRFRGKYLYSDPDPLMGSGQYYEVRNYRTVGIPAEIRFITSTKYIGIGVTAFGNLNDKNSFAGLNISLYGGRMK